MKTSKLFITSLLAAAAMGTVPAFATVSTGSVTVGGTWDNDASSYLTATKDSVGQYYFVAGSNTPADAIAAESAISADIVIGGTNVDTDSTKGLIITDSNQKCQALTGTISGVGILAIKASTGYGTSQLVFSGDVSGFSGKFYVNTANAHTLRFMGASTTALSGTGTIETNKTLVYEKETGDTYAIANSSISAQTLQFTGGANYTISSTLAGNNATASNNTLTISAGTTTFTGAVSNFGNVTVASGATFAVGASGNVNLSSATFAANGTGAVSVAETGTLNLTGATATFGGAVTNAGTLTLTNATATFGGAVTNTSSLNLSGANVALASAIVNSGTVTVNANTIFVLSDSLKIGDTGNTYSLISGNTSGITGWDTLTASNFRISGATISLRGASADVSTAGQVAFTAGTAANLTWKTGASGTWDVQGAQQNWTNDSSGADDVFYDYDSVKFDTTGDVAVSVASTGVSVGTVTITAGTVTLSGGKVSAQDGFFVGDGVSEDDSTAKLVLSDSGALCGDVTVNKGGTFDLNAQSDSMSSDEVNPNRVGKIVLNGGSLTSTGGSQDTNSCQIYNLEVTADSKIIGAGTFGLLGRSYAATTLDLGANTLTKSGGGSFVLVNTTISGNGGVLDVTEGKILGLTEANKNIALGEGVTLKTSGTGGAENIKITSMGANSKLILGGSTASTVTITGAVGGDSADATISISNGNSVSYSGGSLKADVTVTGSGSRFTQSTNNGADQLGYTATVERTFEISNGGTLDLGSNRWTIQKKNLFTLDGGTITGTYQTSGSDTYGSLDFDGADNTLTVNQTHGLASTIESSIRIRGNDVTFEVNDGATLNITGKIGNSKTSNNTVTTTGKLVKTGSGTMTLDLRSLGTSWQNETFTGLKISGGAVVVKNAAVFDTGTTTVEVGSGALLTIAVDGVNTGAVTFAAGSKFALDLTNMTVIEDTALTIIASSAISFNSVSAGELRSNDIETYFDAGHSVLGDYSTWLRDWSYDGSTLSLTMTIPEPSQFGLLAGLAALALAGTRRRRRKA